MRQFAPPDSLRALLQQAPPAACPACPECSVAWATSWIVIAALAGCLVGVCSTLLVQCCRRHTSERRQRLYRERRLSDATHLPDATKEGARTGSPHARLQSGLQQQPSFSPLTARAGPRDSITGNKPPLGGAAAKGGANVLVVHETADGALADDQRVVAAPAAAQAPGTALSHQSSFKSIEQHEGLYLNAEAGGGGSGAPAMATRQTSGGSSGVGGMKRQAAIEQVMNPVYEDRLPPSSSYRAAAAPAASSYGLAHSARTPSPLVTSSAAPATRPTTAATATELESEYELDDLDDDWRWLLADLDKRLIKSHRAPMAPKERAVAIKKLLVATGTRGVDFAMSAAMEEIIRFRRHHPE